MFILLLNCHTDSKQDYLFSQIKEEVFKNRKNQSDKIINVIIITDKDCSPCFEKYRNFENNENIESIGFYFSDYPSDFLQRLLKINKSIDWKQLENKEILTLLNEWDKEGHGPYTFLLKNNKLTINH